MHRGKENIDPKAGNIPPGWTSPSIDEIFEFLNTTSFSRNQLNYEEGNDLYYIHYGDIHATYTEPILDFQKAELIPRINSDEQLPNKVEYLKDGDVVIADASEDYKGIGEAIEVKNLNGKKAISGLHTFALRDKKGLTAEGFRAYIFKNPKVKKALKVIATGSKVYGLSKTNVQKFRIVLPSYPEQQKIAQILRTWDKAIAKYETLITQKQQLKKGLMQQLLTGTKRFKEFDGTWRTETLGSFGKVVSGLTYSPNDVSENGLLVLRSSNVQDRKLAFNDNVYVNIEEGTYNPVKQNDILICVRNGSRNLIGKNAKIDKKSEGLAFGAFMSVFRSDRNDYVFHLFDTEFYNREIHRNLGATINSINGSHLKKFKFPFPGQAERNKISKVLNSLSNEIELLNQHLVHLHNQKKGLMQKLLTGEIPVNT